MFSDLEMHWWLVNTHSAHFVISTETAIIRESVGQSAFQKRHTFTQYILWL